MSPPGLRIWWFEAAVVSGSIQTSSERAGPDCAQWVSAHSVSAQVSENALPYTDKGGAAELAYRYVAGVSFTVEVRSQTSTRSQSLYRCRSSSRSLLPATNRNAARTGTSRNCPCRHRQHLTANPIFKTREVTSYSTKYHRADPSTTMW